MIRPILTSLLILVIATTHAAAEAVPVKIVPGVGITRGGEPYFIKGAAGDKHLDELVATGGNSIRTWTTNGLGPILDAAQQRGLTVCAGIWLEPECHWFSYAKPEHCKRQAERVKKEVLQHRDHPALLFWGIGNEAEGDGNNAAYWKQLEVLAKTVKEIDPAHPTFTAVAGLQPAKVAGIQAHTPSLDFVGINTYGALYGLRDYLAEANWTRPWVVTEYGARGFW
jgi:beta-galactosidase/beta-glucuronidase